MKGYMRLKMSAKMFLWLATLYSDGRVRINLFFLFKEKKRAPNNHQ